MRAPAARLAGARGWVAVGVLAAALMVLEGNWEDAVAR
jgi:hypothetical protein